MGKKARRTATCSQQKECGCSWAVDRISQLPDDILIIILSLMTMEDAAVTSVVARRWKWLWASNTNLNFSLEILKDIIMEPTMQKKFVNWVNYGLALHNHAHGGESFLHNFRVCFDLDKSFSASVDEWFKFALTKRGLQSLEMNLYGLRGTRKNCNFPLSLLDKSMLFGFNSLKSLSLDHVNVTGDIVQHFLSHCPLLERISVYDSSDFGSLKVAGPSLKLKYLDLLCLNGITDIQICDVNLVSFSYIGGQISLLLQNVPLLAEVYIGGGISYIIDDVFHKFLSCCITQLKFLTLDISHIVKFLNLRRLPEFPKLEHLVLQTEALEDNSLLGFTSLIKASPYLQRFVLQLTWMNPIRKRNDNWTSVKSCHQYLKVVELRGYYGRTSDLELAMYFIENAVALEKIIIDPRDRRYPRWVPDVKTIQKEQTTRYFARQQLEGKEPVGVELVIL